MNKVAEYFGTIRVNNSLLFLYKKIIFSYFLCKIQNNCLAIIHYFLSNIINTKINFIFYIELPCNVFVIKKIYTVCFFYVYKSICSFETLKIASD